MRSRSFRDKKENNMKILIEELDSCKKNKNKFKTSGYKNILKLMRLTMKKYKK